ncbi:MAG: hypothetical protein ACO1QB_16010 [Verrucomicrobiales bacterium]
MKRLPPLTTILWVALTIVCQTFELRGQTSPAPTSDPAPILAEGVSAGLANPTSPKETGLMAEAEVPPTKVTLISSEDGLQVKVGENAPLPASSIQSPISQDGARLRVNNGSLVMQAGTHGISLESETIKDWKVSIPKNNSLEITIDIQKAFFDFRTPASNGQKIEMRFPDEGQASMGAGSTARYDHYKDGTYCFSARGDVAGESSDGMKFKFSPNMPPMLGGALQEQLDEKGVKKMHRATPAVPLIIIGDPNQKLSIRIGDQQVELTPGESKTLTTANGSEFSFTHNLARSSLEWQVDKGVGGMSIGGIDCWKGLSLSGQGGVSTWAGSLIDLKNRTKTEAFDPVQTVLVQIGGRIYASTAPGATFQFAKMRDCGSFATAAYGGEVNLYNSDTRVTSPLAQKNLLFEQGSPFQTGGPNTLRDGTALRLTWESDTSIFLRGSSSTIEVKFKSKDVLVVGENELEIQYTETGDLNLRAKIGGFQIKPDFVPDFAINIPQGGSVTLNLQRKNFIFTVKEGVDNDAAIGVMTLSGFSSTVAGSDKVTLVLGQHTFLEAGGNNATWMFFNGNIGTTSFGVLERNAIGNPNLTRPPIVDLRNNTTDIDRVPLKIVSPNSP